MLISSRGQAEWKASQNNPPKTGRGRLSSVLLTVSVAMLAIALVDPAPALDAAALTAVRLEHLPSLHLRLVQGATLIRSVFPLDRIWWASQPEAPDEKVDLATGGANLLVQGAGFVTLGAGEAAFLAKLDGAATLEQAAEAGRAVDSRFDLSTCFAQFLGMSVIAALQQ